MHYRKKFRRGHREEKKRPAVDGGVRVVFRTGERSEMEENVTLNVLDPRGDLFAPPFVPIAARLDTLSGKKIGILRNLKPGADSFAPHLESALKGIVPDIQFRTWVIPYNEYAQKAEEMKALAAWSDAVIGMMGD